FPWPNYAPWGMWEHDDDTAPHWNNGQKSEKLDGAVAPN
ncbi:unnamed protein product, partial [marine sediment metagenome]